MGLGKLASVENIGIGLTQSSNNSLGSVPYAAPEQLESFRDADYRADIYALGKTLVHMLSGKAPISSVSTILLKQIDERYREFVNRCIQDDPDARFQSAADAIAAFNSIT